MPSDRGSAVPQRIVLRVLDNLGCLAIPGDVNVRNLKVHVGDNIYAGNLGNFGDQLWGVPSVIGEGRPPISQVSSHLGSCRVGLLVLMVHASHHMLDKRRAVLALIQHPLTKDLPSHLENCILRE